MKQMLAGATCLLMAGCMVEGKVDSSRVVATSQIYPTFRVLTGADGISHVGGVFKELDFDDVALAHGELLTITAPGASAAFAGPGAWFAFDMDTGNAEDTPFQFDFERQRRRLRDAPESRGTLPPPMDLQSPQEGAEFNIGSDSIPVAWLPGGSADSMGITLAGPCTDPADGRNADVFVPVSGDPGADTVKLSDHDFEFPQGCRRFAVKLTLTRSRDGELDPHYAEGGDQCQPLEGIFYACSAFTLTQERHVNIVITR